MTKGPDRPREQLEAMVRERIEQGLLPVAVSATVSAAYGGLGAKCEVCKGEIKQREWNTKSPE